MKFSNLEGIKSLAVVGATGLVGQEFLALLAEHKIAIPRLVLLASENSEGETVEVDGKDYTVETLSGDSFDGIEVAFFSVPDAVTKKYAPIATAHGCLVIDDSSVFRMDPNVPLVVPEVNGSLLRQFEGSLVSVPNCTVTPLTAAIAPLVNLFGVKRIVVSTYQSVSGAGKDAYDELSEQAASMLNGMPKESSVFPRPIAFNCLPQIGAVEENGYTSEEMKLVKETRKILGIDTLKISSTTVRVPTFCAHALSVNVEFEKNFDKIEEIRELLDKTPGIKVIDQPENHVYPTNLDAIGSDEVFVGRIRRDYSVGSGVNLWIVADNLRKGAALNALQILETLYNYRRMA